MTGPRVIGVRFHLPGQSGANEARPDPEGDYPDLEEFDRLFPEGRPYARAGVSWSTLFKMLAATLWPVALMVGCAAAMIARGPNSGTPSG